MQGPVANGGRSGLTEDRPLVFRDLPPAAEVVPLSEDWADTHLGGRLGRNPVGMGVYLPSWLENSPATLLSRNFEVDARLARNAVLSRKPLPALDLAHPVPSRDPTLEVLCTLREGGVTLPVGSPRPLLPLALKWGDHVS